MAREDLLVLGKARTRETMTPKEKAKELYHKFQVYEVNGQKHVKYGPEVKVFALIAIDEVLYALSVPPINNKGHLLYDGQIDYWHQVKKEIEKL